MQIQKEVALVQMLSAEIKILPALLYASSCCSHRQCHANIRKQ
jgi:hypothetical protein